MSARPVKTVYRMGRKVVKITHSNDPLRAQALAGMYLKGERFDADRATVTHEETGRLYAEIRLWRSGKLETLFEANARDFVTESTMRFFKQGGFDENR